MSINKTDGRFHWLSGAVVGALALTAIAVPLTPAKAQIGVQVGPFGVGVGPYYNYYGPGPYYYGYDPYWHHHHYYGW